MLKNKIFYAEVVVPILKSSKVELAIHISSVDILGGGAHSYYYKGGYSYGGAAPMLTKVEVTILVHKNLRWWCPSPSLYWWKWSFISLLNQLYK